MPNRMAVFGIEAKTLDTYPRDRRAAALVAPLPFWWLAEVLVERSPGAAVDVPHPVAMDWLTPTPEMLTLGREIGMNCLVLSRVDSVGWQVFEHDEMTTLAGEMIKIGEGGGFPGADRIAMAGRLVERASRVPSRVTFFGR